MPAEQEKITTLKGAFAKLEEEAKKNPDNPDIMTLRGIIQDFIQPKDGDHWSEAGMITKAGRWASIASESSTMTAIYQKYGIDESALKKQISEKDIDNFDMICHLGALLGVKENAPNQDKVCERMPASKYAAMDSMMEASQDYNICMNSFLSHRTENVQEEMASTPSQPPQMITPTSLGRV